MGSVNDVGTPGAPMSTPPLTVWQDAVRDALDGSDITVDTRIATAVDAVPATLAEQGDVSIGTPLEGEALTYDSTVGLWVNRAAGGAGGGGGLDGLTDVIITEPALQEVITYNGTAWVNDVVPQRDSDTGWIDVTPLLDPEFQRVPGGVLLLRRTGWTVWFLVNGVTHPTAIPTLKAFFTAFPEGFAPTVFGASAYSVYDAYGSGMVVPDAFFTLSPTAAVLGKFPGGAVSAWGILAFVTEQSWPTTLPSAVVDSPPDLPPGMLTGGK